MSLFIGGAIGTFGIAIESDMPPQPLLATVIFIALAVGVHLVTPTQEQMLTAEYDDIIAARPACAIVIEKDIDSASMECLKQYKDYVEDSAKVAKSYYDHFGELKQGLKR